MNEANIFKHMYKACSEQNVLRDVMFSMWRHTSIWRHNQFVTKSLCEEIYFPAGSGSHINTDKLAVMMAYLVNFWFFLLSS